MDDGAVGAELDAHGPARPPREAPAEGTSAQAPRRAAFGDAGRVLPSGLAASTPHTLAGAARSVLLVAAAMLEPACEAAPA
ncbi:MAG TPA: hypothetical protein VFC93_04060 [Chloroflexota bacterium]|nr:hypothetical protein [Chloroflexota bacterium]